MRAEFCASAGTALILLLVSALLDLRSKSKRMEEGSSFSYLRPRGALARTLYERMANDKAVEEFDKKKWYMCNLDAIQDEKLRQMFVQLELDKETEQFLEDSTKKSENIILQMWHTMVSAVLQWFLTRTSINGLLSRGSMFIFSTSHFRRLLPRVPGGTLLDLGAGDGMITDVMAPTFGQVFATEMSPTMRHSLAQRGYKVLDVENWSESGPFDVVSCLNLLDRCSKPWSLLTEIRKSLVPDTGRLIVALVLPFQPYVEANSPDHSPEESLNINGERIEDQINSTVLVLQSAGFEIERWTRLPYLCEGDLGQSYYWLDDVVFVLKPV
ncbi:protein-L-histidine N-pros-methyltransferase [Cloeon dipterum]|uniref:protein-L-histidine N-pros-methyltransferase n=1 Tax=Cloeon dipterum TaxID=197152 RepID=UPI00321F68C2